MAEKWSSIWIRTWPASSTRFGATRRTWRRYCRIRRLTHGLLLTAGNGEVENTLTIGDAVKNLKVPVVIDVMGTTKTMIFTPDDLTS